MPVEKQPDVTIANHGTVALLTPITAAAREWVEEHVQIESWQRLAGSIACEPRCLEDLIAGLQAEGFTVQSD
jgi:hypothetical protein